MTNQTVPSAVEAEIDGEYFFTAEQGANAAIHECPGSLAYIAHPGLDLTMFCVLVLKNGHRVAGVAHCADPATFDIEIGKKAARADAIRQAWPMVIYAKRNDLEHRVVRVNGTAEALFSQENTGRQVTHHPEPHKLPEQTTSIDIPSETRQRITDAGPYRRSYEFYDQS